MPDEMLFARDMIGSLERLQSLNRPTSHLTASQSRTKSVHAFHYSVVRSTKQPNLLCLELVGMKIRRVYLLGSIVRKAARGVGRNLRRDE